MARLFQKGFILPATIMLGLGIAIMSTTFMQFTATTSQTLSSRNYSALAAEAARAGITYANSCIESNTVTWSTLTPMTDCSGAAGSTDLYIVESTDYRTTFSVAAPTVSGNLLTIISTGTVQRLSGSSVVSSTTATSKTTLPSTTGSSPVATGVPITDIRNDDDDCAIANGELYCWGAGVGSPTRIQGALAGKTVTNIDVSYESKCAVADGLPYCWGSNGNSQLGNGGGSLSAPTANSPRTSSGPLNGQYVTEISTASSNNPASVIWPFAIAFPHSCALTADGAVSCWGYGGYRQLTGGGQRYACFIFCVPVPGYWSYPSHGYPTLVKGYEDNSGPFAGKKAERVGASSHDSCLLAEGQMYCWGVRAPIDLWCNSVLFSDADLTLVPFNLCVANYSNGYEPGGSLSGRLIDSDTWDISANEACMMANTSYVCFGTTPAFGLFWLDSWGAPWTAISNADVTVSDNGDNIPSWGLLGLYCLVDAGVPKCSVNFGSPYAGTGYNGYKNIQPLVTSSGLAGKVSTKIAAGQDHGCVIANGQLLCWGEGGSGRLGDGNTSGHYVAYATVSGTGGATPIGTTEGTLAADGPVSTGAGHSCAVVNGDIFCWGKNDYGQLGLGNTDEKYGPIALPSEVGSVYRQVSAGTNHTCGISDAQLYCWGLNSNGQLGLGNTTSYNTPQLVSYFSGMRVADVSAGATGTCAIADGQPYCWGLNSNQQVGDGTATQRTSPVLVNGGTGSPLVGKYVGAISMGTTHACAAANSDLYCWGNNANGRTGLNTITGNSNPTLVTGGTAGSPLGPNNMRPRVSEVSAGNDSTCAVINSMVSCWGNNANGRTGRTGVTTGNTLVPTAISNTHFATKVDVGDSHACALLHGNNSRTNGNMWCWGDATSGRIGNGASSGDVSTPIAITGGDNSGRSGIAISAGESNTCAVAKGTIQCWGAGANGRLGNGGTSNVLSPDTTSDYTFFSPFQKGPIY